MPSYLVTGGSRGLGLGFIAELVSLLIINISDYLPSNARAQLQDPQNYVIATARSSNSTPELQKLLTKHAEMIAFVQLDIADPASIEKAAVDVAKLVPEGLDTLISNAGVNFQPKATLEDAFVTTIH